MPTIQRTTPFGLAPVPFGRHKEAVESIPEDKRDRVAYVVGAALGAGDQFYRWPNREAMAKQIRRDEAKAPTSRYVPLVKLGTTEGWS